METHNLTEKQLNLLQWLVKEARADRLDEEEIWIYWTDRAHIINYEGSVPEIKRTTLDALESNRCIVGNRKGDKKHEQYVCGLTRKAYEIIDLNEKNFNLQPQELSNFLKPIAISNSIPLATSISIFISCSHQDEEFRDKLVMHLANLKRQGRIRTWSDRDIEAGTEWNVTIKHQLETAQIILLLISSRFLSSDRCYDVEMQQALQRHNEGSAQVIPVILQPCDWQGSPFSELKILPKDAKPITRWDNRDEAFLDIVQGIRKVIEGLQGQEPEEKTPVLETPHPAHPTSKQPFQPYFSTYNPQTFTGREAEIKHLSTRLKEGCRIVAIAGITGIGKTALSERVVAHVLETSTSDTLPYFRFSLDDRNLTPEFVSSGAALLRTLGEEPTLEDQKDPANLVHHILTRLQRHPCRLQIDSLEKLLQGDEQEGWSKFCDPLWLDLLHQLLAANDNPSQLLLTTQDIPSDLDGVASRYPQFWYYQPLQGLSLEEQQELFQKLGLVLHLTDNDLDYLSRIGMFYNGHPLVLQVIADDIRQPPFQGSITLYWNHYQAEFIDNSTENANKLERSRLFRRRVRQRVEQSLQCLPVLARQMLWNSAVFRRPVSIDFWYAMLSEDDPQGIFDTLQERYLIEYTPALGSAPLVRQHNLIRSVAYDLLKSVPSSWEAAERQAAHLWLTAYEPPPNATNLETVRGYLEAFDHYYEIGDWVAATGIAYTKLESGNSLYGQLFIWSYFRELVPLHIKMLAIAQKLGDRQGESNNLSTLGIIHHRLGHYQQAIEWFHQGLTVARTIGDRASESYALGNLGNLYTSLAQYDQAIEFLQQHLAIAREMDSRIDEGLSLAALGVAYKNVGQYDPAIEFLQQGLAIAREIGDRQGESYALGNLGVCYVCVDEYEQAIHFLHQGLAIAQAIGDRIGEGRILGSLGITYRSLAQYEQAIHFLQAWLSTAQDIGDRWGEGIALLALGGSRFKLGQYTESLLDEQNALDIFRETGDRANEADALKNLAELHQALGEIQEARQYGEQALAIATDLDIPLKSECQSLMKELEQHVQGS